MVGNLGNISALIAREFPGQAKAVHVWTHPRAKAGGGNLTKGQGGWRQLAQELNIAVGNLTKSRGSVAVGKRKRLEHWLPAAVPIA